MTQTRNRHHSGTCSLDGCDAPYEARGYCNRHYLRFKKTGDPLGVLVDIHDPVSRFTSTYQETGDGCWLWTGWVDGAGYARFTVNGKRWLAHRWSYQHHRGPIPQGLVIDHLCRTPSCVNPSHLEAVPQRENVHRGTGTPAVNLRKTHCLRGHAFTPANTYVNPRTGARRCRQCRRVTGGTKTRAGNTPAT